MILQSAARLLAERGYTATSLEDVAAEAGVTKPMIYYHFDSKEGLYWSVVFPLAQSGVTTVEEIIRTTPSPDEAILKIIRAAASRAQDPDQRYMYYQELIPLSDDMREALRATERQYEALVAQVIERGQALGLVIQGDAQVLALFLIGAVARTARWFQRDGRVPPEEFWTTFATMVLDGLFTRSRAPYQPWFAPQDSG